jgi:hypothetical protein
MPLYETTPMPLTQYSAFSNGVIPTEVFGVAINWYINRTPLTARLPKEGLGSPQFTVIGDSYRPRQALTGASIADTSTQTITPDDPTQYEVGDVLQIESEYILVTARTANGTTLTGVTRGYNGSTAAAHTTVGTPIYLITNTRTGAEVDQDGIAKISDTYTQYAQTIQHPYQVGGALEADTNFVTGTGRTPLDRFRMLALQHTMDDFESALIYGIGQPLSSATARPAMKGIFTILPSTNKTSSPTNASGYKPSDLMRDTVAKCVAGGGNPSLLVCSTDFMSGLSVWGSPAMRLEAGTSVFGTPINLWAVPFLGGLKLVTSAMLRTGSAICLSEGEARIRLKRPMFDKPRGSRGDAFEGDVIMEGAIELDNPAHHAMVTGITAFAKES